MKTIVYVLFLTLLIQGCSFDFFNSDKDSDSTGVVKRYELDSVNDIKYYYEDDVLKWKEYYDYNDSGKCIFVKHQLMPSDTTGWSYVYTWDNDKLITEAYFTADNELSWFNSYSYTESNITLQASYSANSQLQDFTSFSYNSSGKVELCKKYSSSSALEWAYEKEYDVSENLISSSYYTTDGTRKAYITYEYDGSNREIKRTGYGTTSRTDTFSCSPNSFSFPAYGGQNTTDRNTASLAAPSNPAYPSVPSTSFTSTVYGSHTWLSLWVYDTYGYSLATLNSNNLPIYLERSAPDYLNGKPVIIDIAYSDQNKVLSKTTNYGGSNILKLEFGYNSGGYPETLNTSGEALLIPLNYKFIYTSKNKPATIEIYNETNLLQKFVYEYSAGDTFDKNDLEKNISKITHYNGDNTLIGTYNFSYDDPSKSLTISVLDAQGSNNGKFILQYNADENLTRFASYSKDNEKLWDYRYTYDSTYKKRISETNLNKDDVPEVVSSFNIETLFEDIKIFMP